MDLTTERGDDGATVRLCGRFDAHEAAAFRVATAPLAERDRIIRVNLSDVAFIDSTALAELVALTRRAEDAGGEVRIVSPSTPVRVILQITGLDLALVMDQAAETVP